jgi:hypothetical protein
MKRGPTAGSLSIPTRSEPARPRVEQLAPKTGYSGPWVVRIGYSRDGAFARRVFDGRALEIVHRPSPRT